MRWWTGEGWLWRWSPEGSVVPPGWTLVAQTSCWRFSGGELGPYGYHSVQVRVGLGHIVAGLVWLWWELRFPWFLRRQRELWAEFQVSKGLKFVGPDEAEVEFWSTRRTMYGQEPPPFGTRFVRGISYIIGR